MATFQLISEGAVTEPYAVIKKILGSSEWTLHGFYATEAEALSAACELVGSAVPEVQVQLPGDRLFYEG